MSDVYREYRQTMRDFRAFCWAYWDLLPTKDPRTWDANTYSYDKIRNRKEWIELAMVLKNSCASAPDFPQVWKCEWRRILHALASKTLKSH